MNLYKKWQETAYTKDGSGQKEHWDKYLPAEEKVYRHILQNKISKISGSLEQVSKDLNLDAFFMIGFIDGLQEILPEKIELEALSADSEISLDIDFEKLFKKMVEYKAEHLFTLEDWDNIFSKEEQARMFKEQKLSNTVVKDEKTGRNDACPCGSGKKYKKCCGQSA